VVSNRDIRLQRLIDAPIEVTFREWTDPESRRQWSAPGVGWKTEATSDLRVGGVWRVRFEPSPDEMYAVDGCTRLSTRRAASCTARCSGIPMAGRSRP
jgi:uncharacterized protein YndB with AHSA1/START domain